MAYDTPRFHSDAGYPDGQGYGPSGFDDVQAADYGQEYPAEYEQPVAASPIHVTEASGDGFDHFDPPEERDGTDRISVHLLWEGVLLLFVGVALYLLHDSAPSALRGSAFHTLLLSATVVGLVSVGASFSLRAATPNLAVGPVAYAAAVFFADRSDGGLTTAALTTALAAAGIGAVIAALAVGFNVPSWAASLGVGVAIMVWLERQDEVAVVNGAYQPENHALYWFFGCVALSVLGGFFGSIRPIRTTIGGYRATGDPGVRMPAAAATGAVLALVASTVLASVGGVLYALGTRPVAVEDGGLSLTVLALGAALLGGTSAHGRRGGIFGTALAVTLLVLLRNVGDARDWNLTQLAVGAAAILAGLIATRLVEAFGHADPADEAERGPIGASPRSPSGWGASRGSPAPSPRRWAAGEPADGWTTQLPARTGDEGWESQDRWSTR